MDFETLWGAFYEFMVLLSLGLTPPALVASFVTALKWRNEHKAYMRADNPTETQTINAGIFRGFAGSFVDNLWWGFAWSFDYLGMEGPRNFFFAYGVMSNVFFRQSATIWAATLHLRAEAMSHHLKTERQAARLEYKRIIVMTAVLTSVYIGALIYLK